MLDLKNISKSFSGVKALSDVSFTLQAGEVHALCGENGAGKSTLMNIVAGNLKPDEGSLHLKGELVTFNNHQQAGKKGIAIVYQDRSLVNTLSVAENIFLNHYPLNRFGFIDYKKLYVDTSQVLAGLELQDIKPDMLVKDLSPAQEQMIEIAKSLVKEPEILILDEPTASITEKETRILFQIIKKLTAKGVGIIYISHRLAEVFLIADRVTVLKDGKVQGTLPIEEVNQDKLISLMVGRSLGQQTFENFAQKEVALKVQNLSGKGFHNISFQVARGEIVALAGLIGAGRTEIAKTIFGALQKTNGEVMLYDSPCHFTNTSDAVTCGIAYVAEDRKQQSIFADMSMTENMLAAKYAGAGFAKYIPEKASISIAESFKEKLHISTPSLDKKIKELSGGNQQKTILARWLSMEPKVLIVDEPTQGVDVGAKFEIYELLHNLARQGTAILLVSSELPEVLTLANRIIVIWQGMVAGEISKENATEEKILHLASGLNTVN
ncbi:MAG: sugar ABC transporter ATP-binding protein [Cyclobacteriaceae bacterium]